MGEEQSTSQGRTPGVSGTLQTRHVIAVIIGNALEFYDFLVYSLFALQVGRTFLPARSPSASLLLSLAIFGVLGAFTALAQAPQLTAITESLPRASRAGTLAVVYALAIAICGGSTQLMITWLIGATGSPLAPAWYMLGATIIGIAALTGLRESAPLVRVPPTTACD